MYLVIFSKQAAKDAKRLKSAGLDAKAKDLIDIVRKDPFQNPSAFESLVGNMSGLYSRRINLQHRFVYQVIADAIEVEGTSYQGIVKVIRMWTHYEGV